MLHQHGNIGYWLFEQIEEHEHDIQASKLVVFDGNLSPDLMAELSAMAARHRVPVWFEPTSVPKASRAIERNAIANITVISPDWRELLAVSNALAGHDQEAPPIANDYALDRSRFSFGAHRHPPGLVTGTQLMSVAQTWPSIFLMSCR